MAYTFNAALTDEVSLVRFHTGDNHDEGHFVEDETIQYFIDQASWETAVIACIRYIITQLSQPNFVADWLEVNLKDARQGYEKLLKDKQKELGLSSTVASSTVSLPSRADSYQVNNDYKEVEED